MNASGLLWCPQYTLPQLDGKGKNELEVVDHSAHEEICGLKYSQKKKKL